MPSSPADVAAGFAVHPVRKARPVMGTWASIHVHDDDDQGRIDRAIDDVLTELDRLEDMFSTFRPSSEISRLNRQEIDLGDVSAEVIEVLDHCTWLEHASRGAFDIRPRGFDGPIDPAGFVKGWATERASRMLAAAGLHHWYVSVGGDMVVSGRPGPDRSWRVGVVDPRDAGKIRATIELESGALATSGTAERGRHIWDPRTHVAADTFASVTVVGPSLAWADAFATTAFVMGEAGLRWVARYEGYRALAIGHDGSTATLPGDVHGFRRAPARRG